MLTYKVNPGCASPGLIIPSRGDVDNLAVDIFIDTPPHTTRLYYAFELPVFNGLKQQKIKWLAHDGGVLPEYFADRLWGGVRVVKVVTSGSQPVLIKIKPIYKSL